MIRRLSTRLLAGAAALAVLFVVASSLTPASAAHLTVTTSGIVTDTAQRCSAVTLQTTAPSAASTSTLTITGVPAACRDKPFDVRFLNASGASVGTGTGTTAAGSGTTTATNLPAYNSTSVVSVALFIDGWWITNTWAVTAPTAPATCVPMNAAGTVVAGTCTVSSITATGGWGSVGARTVNVYVSVTSSAPRFRITFDYSKAPFEGWTPVSVTSGNFDPAPGASCSTLPVFTMNSPPWNTNSYFSQISQIPGTGDLC